VAIVVQVTVPAPQPVAVQVTEGGAVTVAAVLSPQSVNVAAVQEPQAVNVAAVQSPQVVQVEAVSRIVPGADGDPGDDGPPGANAEIVVLTLAAYLALAPEVQMDGRWYVIPKT